MAGDNAPHFTTIAGFVSTLSDEIARLFARILYLCDQQGLIGRAEFIERAAKLETEVKKMVARHRAEDAHLEPALDAKPQNASNGYNAILNKFVVGLHRTHTNAKAPRERSARAT